MAKKESYEEMIKKLEDVLDTLENGDLNLEDSMKTYEIGVKLVNKLYKTLDQIEGKISMVKDSKEVEFDGQNEDK